MACLYLVSLDLTKGVVSMDMSKCLVNLAWDCGAIVTQIERSLTFDLSRPLYRDLDTNMAFPRPQNWFDTTR